MIGEDDTVGSVYERLMKRGAALLLKTVQAIDSGNAPSVPQAETGTLMHAPKIFRDTCEINWDRPVSDIRNFVRGLNPFPSAWTKLRDKTYKIMRVGAAAAGRTAAPGTIDTDEQTYLHVKAADGWVAIEELQPEGKKKMNIRDFFRGNKL